MLADSGGGFGALFTALGLNWQALILNAIAVLLVVWILGHFVFPTLIKALDSKRDELTAATRLEQAAKEALERGRTEVNSLINEARTTADEIITEARAEAAAMAKASSDKAEVQAGRIIDEGRAQLAHDVTTARQSLRRETAHLVASATEKIIDVKLDGAKDEALITAVLGGRR